MGESTIKNNKIITAISASTLRAIIDTARELDIQKEDIVTLMKEGNNYILVYYEGIH